MYDREAVIRHTIRATEANASWLGQPLRAFVQASTKAEKGFAEQALRDALLVQAEGYDGTSHNGSTFETRVREARLALTAWDGPQDPIGTEECIIELPGFRLPEACSRALAAAAGFEVLQTEDGTHYACLGTHDRYVNKPFVIALSEGLRGNEALVRAIALREQANAESAARASAETVAEKEREAAAMRLAAEREVTKRGR